MSLSVGETLRKSMEIDKCQHRGILFISLFLPLNGSSLPDIHGSMVQCEFSTIRKRDREKTHILYLSVLER